MSAPWKDSPSAATLRDGVDDVGVGVAGDHRPPGAHQVDRLPSASVSQYPWAEVMNRGVPPTEVKARTGEFTPPGMTAQASANSFAETP